MGVARVHPDPGRGILRRSTRQNGLLCAGGNRNGPDLIVEEYKYDQELGRALRIIGQRIAFERGEEKDDVPENLQKNHRRSNTGKQPVTRKVRLASLQARWEGSLSDRAQLCPRSIVPTLDGLLAPYRQPPAKIRSQLAPKIGHRRVRDAEQVSGYGR